VTASRFVTLLVLVVGMPLFLLKDEKPAASKVTLHGNESLGEVVTALRKTGNTIELLAATETPLKLPAGTYDFWPLVDEVSRQARLQVRLRNDHVELGPAESEAGPCFIAYDGPFRAVIARRTIIAYDDPALDRLTLHVELACEPRMQPILLKVPGGGITWRWSDARATSIPSPGVASYGFEGEKVRAFEARLPRPDRGVKQIDQLTIQGTVWVSSRRLAVDLPLKAGSEVTQAGTSLHLDQIDTPPGRPWEVVTTLSYPPESMEWESHQAGLLSSLSLSLVSGNQSATPVGREVRTDESRRLEIRWLFRNVPGRPDAWRLRGHVPSAPVAYPLKLEFKNVALP